MLWIILCRHQTPFCICVVFCMRCLLLLFLFRDNFLLAYHIHHQMPHYHKHYRELRRFQVQSRFDHKLYGFIRKLSFVLTLYEKSAFGIGCALGYFSRFSAFLRFFSFFFEVLSFFFPFDFGVSSPNGFFPCSHRSLCPLPRFDGQKKV